MLWKLFDKNLFKYNDMTVEMIKGTIGGFYMNLVD